MFNYLSLMCYSLLKACFNVKFTVMTYYHLVLGTLLDGEPIINLPPKEIKLKQVEFTDEERQFYNQLEIDSRDQFKVWFHYKSSFRLFFFKFLWLIIFMQSVLPAAFANSLIFLVRNMRLLEP